MPFAEDAAAAHRFQHLAVNHDLGLPFDHDVHDVAGVALGEDDFAGREREQRGITGQQVDEGHGGSGDMKSYRSQE